MTTRPVVNREPISGLSISTRCVSRDSVLPRPRNANVNHASYAQDQDESRHQDQSVREHGPLDGHTRGLSPSDDLLLQGKMNIGRDDGQFVGNRCRDIADGVFVQNGPARG